jgi:hypothetical protein
MSLLPSGLFFIAGAALLVAVVPRDAEALGATLAAGKVVVVKGDAEFVFTIHS